MAWYPHSLSVPRTTALVGLATLLGCSGTIVIGSDASTTTTRALLSIESTTAAGDAAGSGGAHASAYFLRLQAGADHSLAARVVGTSLALPPLGQCAPVELVGDEGMPLGSLGPVDLVDVGQVALQGPRSHAVLAARAFPDVVDLVSGVVYTTRDPVADTLREPGMYTFQIAGSQALPSMRLEGRAPGTAEGLYVGGYPLGGEPLALLRGDLTLNWRPIADANVVYIELASLEDGPLERLRCAFSADGPGLVPASALPKASLQSLSVHAVHRENVSAPGLDGGEIRFDLAVSGTIRFDGSHP
jgi:hypothetical protein